jgi:hypothetical protein
MPAATDQAATDQAATDQAATDRVTAERVTAGPAMTSLATVSTRLYDVDIPPLDLTLEGRPEPPEPLHRRTRRRAGAWLAEHRASVLVIGALMVLGGLMHAMGMDGTPARFDDEGTYTAYAWAVQNLGVLGHYTYWYAHPPLGWMQIAAWTWLTDGFDRAPYAVAAAREFTLVCKLVSIPLLYGVGRRLGFGRAGAAGAVVIFSLSPLALYFTRAALLDNIVTPWLLAAFFLALAPRRSTASAVGSAVTFAIAVLTKETALLYLPAVLLALWQTADRRNRRFTLVLFFAWLAMVGGAYPLYALIKNELLAGPGHVSIEAAVRWQLFERVGSGSVFDHKSTAYAVVRSWIDQDQWLPRLSLLLAVPGLLIRRTRAVAAALVIQLAQMLRGGYLPYPYVVAMIPFAALTVAGVVDWLWSVGAGSLGSLPGSFGSFGSLSGLGERSRAEVSRWLWSMAVGLTCAWLVLTVGQAWSVPLRDLRATARDTGKAEALRWLLTQVPRGDRLVVDDAFWVDLVRAGHPRDQVIWFTKLDVDQDVKIPESPQWSGIDYIVLDQQDDRSLHIQTDGRPSKDTLRMFPTLGQALAHSRVVESYGVGLDGVTIRKVDPLINPKTGSRTPVQPTATKPAAKPRAAVKPAAKPPAGTKPAAKRAAAKPAAKPAAAPPAAKVPATKPAAKVPAAKGPATGSRAARTTAPEVTR